MAFEWYEMQRRGLGSEFLDCVETALDNIADFPEMYQIAYSRFRGCVIRRFPFSIFYAVESEEIIVHCVFDNRRDPEKRH
uniref:ParE toxin of type II toxin-antitoxin system, parDE n=1 Tax=Candidatus Kentrum sp. DK TaxID=2126562 RepID=A0A450RTM4_9GAMM|nr:MAG: ParE toxin of type II toxin-antitoxin system, parDE [Candidatus Kentron sp. DK]